MVTDLGSDVCSCHDMELYHSMELLSEKVFGQDGWGGIGGTSNVSFEFSEPTKSSADADSGFSTRLTISNN